MDKKVTMNTKGVTQDDSGNYGIWRTVRKVGKIFIHVGETGHEAVSRKMQELLNTPIEQLKNQVQKPLKEKLRPKVMDKISSVRNELEQNGSAYVRIYTFEYKYLVEVKNDDEYSYKILYKEKLK